MKLLTYLTLCLVIKVRVVLLTPIPDSTVADTARLEAVVAPSAQIVDVKAMADPYPQLNRLAYQVDRLQNLSEWARKKRLNRGVDHVHFIVSPMKEGGVTYIGGLARRVCTLGSHVAFSMSNYSAYNSQGLPRQRYSAISAAHEIGHALGAEHRDYTPNIMHSNALFYLSNTSLGWLPETRTDIDRCIIKYGKTRS